MNIEHSLDAVPASVRLLADVRPEPKAIELIRPGIVRRQAMADTIRQVDYFYVIVSHKAGEGAKVLRTLKDAGVNLLAFSGFPAGRRAQLDFI